MKKMVIILFKLLLISGIFAQGYQPRIAIEKPGYRGMGETEANSILRLITDIIQNGGDFILVREIADSEYYISTKIEKKENIYDIDLILFETKSKQAVENFNKVNIKKIDIESIFQAEYTMIKEKLFRIDNYLAENQVYFKSVDPALISDRSFGAISRINKEKSPVGNIAPIVSVTENVFRRYPLSVSLTGAMIIPVNLFNQDVSNSLFMDFSTEYSFFTSSIIMLSAYVGTNYFFLEKPTSSTTSNILHVVGLGAGIGICFPLPFLRQLSLHLFGGGGYGISTIASIQYMDSIPISGDFFVNSLFEMRFALSSQISVNLNAAYKLVFYSDALLSNFTIGAGVTYRI